MFINLLIVLWIWAFDQSSLLRWMRRGKTTAQIFVWSQKKKEKGKSFSLKHVQIRIKQCRFAIHIIHVFLAHWVHRCHAIQSCGQWKTCRPAISLSAPRGTNLFWVLLLLFNKTDRQTHRHRRPPTCPLKATTRFIHLQHLRGGPRSTTWPRQLRLDHKCPHTLCHETPAVRVPLGSSGPH